MTHATNLLLKAIGCLLTLFFLSAGLLYILVFIEAIGLLQFTIQILALVVEFMSTNQAFHGLLGIIIGLYVIALLLNWIATTLLGKIKNMKF